MMQRVAVRPVGILLLACRVLQCVVAVWCSVLQCVAMCCSVLQCAAVCCSVLQCVIVYCSAAFGCFFLACRTLQCVAVCCSMLQYVAVCCSMLQCVVARCSVLQCVAVCCSVLQCITVYYSVLHYGLWVSLPCCVSCTNSHFKQSHYHQQQGLYIMSRISSQCMRISSSLHSLHIHLRTHIHSHRQDIYIHYGVTTNSRLLQITGLFCRI